VKYITIKNIGFLAILIFTLLVIQAKATKQFENDLILEDSFYNIYLGDTLNRIIKRDIARYRYDESSRLHILYFPKKTNTLNGNLVQDAIVFFSKERCFLRSEKIVEKVVFNFLGSYEKVEKIIEESFNIIARESNKTTYYSVYGNSIVLKRRFSKNKTGPKFEYISLTLEKPNP
jgi:hypothetical protein